MVVAMLVSDASSKASLNHNDKGATPYGGASCYDSVMGTYINTNRTKLQKDFLDWPNRQVKPAAASCLVSLEFSSEHE